jgi:hypothetical protein
MLQYRIFFDIVLDRYQMFLPSISIYSRFRAFDNNESISNYKTFDIEFNIESRYRRSFSNARYRTFQLQYRNIPISKVQRSILNVAKVPDGHCSSLRSVTRISSPACQCHEVQHPEQRRACTVTAAYSAYFFWITYFGYTANLQFRIIIFYHIFCIFLRK